MEPAPDHETITTKDGTEIHHKDCGKGPAVTFSHGWPLNSDMWGAFRGRLPAALYR
jgi:pimeloyl-ACP methyl ester carboxylesterase